MEQVDRAIRTAFGATTYATSPVTGGMSGATILRAVVDGRAYLVRVGGSPHADAASEMANVQQAAEAGLAPRVYYASVADRTMITDFIDHVPYADGTGAQVAAMIARLQQLPPYPRTIHQLDFTAGMIARYPKRDADDIFAAYAEVAAAYPRDAVVACHNDLKSPNILFDGARPWFVDWEAAFSNDRYADLANAASFFRIDEAALLAAYLGAPAGDVERARFFLMRFAIHCGYVALVGKLAADAPPQPTPDFHAFHADLDIHSLERKQQYANIHLAAARAALRSPRFAASLAAIR